MAAQKTAQQEAYDNLDNDFATLANVVAMLSWHLVQNISRIEHPDGGVGWFIGQADGNEAMSLLRMADQFGKRVVKQLEGAP